MNAGRKGELTLSQSSKTAWFLAFFLVLIIAVGIASAVSPSGDPPPPAEPGERVSVEATLEEPFRNAPDHWTMQGTTELDRASWTIQLTADGDPVDTVDVGGPQFSHDLSSEFGPTSVQLLVAGEVPDKPDSSTYEALTISRVSNGASTELASWEGIIITDQTRTVVRETSPDIDTPTQTPARGQDSNSINRGFFTNAPSSGIGLLNNVVNITTIGFALSIIGILLQLRRGG